MTQELPKERLATTDETGKRVYLYPAKVTGTFTSLKRKVHAFLMLLFLVLPWIYVGGQQLVKLDVAHREFFIFGLHLRAHDAPMLVFLFLSFTFLIGLITAIWGRLWCGWACPQTVFIESVYRRIETWIEGGHRERRALDEGPWTGEKLTKKALKWLAFASVSLVITHSFLAYFVGSRELLGMVTGSPTQHWEAFLVILITTGIILLDFGWFREQFCVIMCPYGRFQSVMLDSQSLVVGYDARRGEPRRGFVPEGEKQGDCVNCFRCVQVCPTGIDIRRGLQMECIACTACIDACDEVMTKIKKPTGLIRYTTLAELNNRPKRFSVRPVIYGLLLAAAMGGLTFALGTKEFLEVALLRAPGLPYEMIQVEGAPRVMNHFRLDLSNQTGKAAKVAFAIDAAAKGQGVELVFPMNPLDLADSASQRVDFFVRFPKEVLENGSRKIPFRLSSEGRDQEMELSLVGPNR